jgi:hypothetical protein
MTFKEYMLLSDDDQSPIVDDIIKERTVVCLIVRNLTNKILSKQLVQTFSVNNNTYYPNNISITVSLLSTTFSKPSNISNGNNGSKEPTEDAVVSYYEYRTSQSPATNISKVESVIKYQLWLMKNWMYTLTQW